MSSKENSKVAKRYARALFEASPKELLELIGAELKEVSQIWLDSIELRSSMLNPAISLDERTAVLRDLVANTTAAEILGNFLCVLLENKRITALPEVEKSFASILAAFKETLAIEVTSAFPIAESEKEEITAEVKNSVGSMVSISWKVDESLIGGLRIQAGDKVLDNTIRGSLNKIGHSLLQ